ncbi:MAG: hypothetical protein LH629_09470, partial [Ignavibacteria bacterium]|nr:hypothetical protein [Ignavibacteria bacterium]
NHNERFVFIYANQKPIARMDGDDKDFENYIPTDADLKWDVNQHLKNILNANDYRKLNIHD